MSISTLDAVKNEAMLLSIKDRAILIHELLETLDGKEENVEEAWAFEAENRLAAYRQGQSKTRTAAEVFANIESQLK